MACRGNLGAIHVGGCQTLQDLIMKIPFLEIMKSLCSHHDRVVGGPRATLAHVVEYKRQVLKRNMQVPTHNVGLLPERNIAGGLYVAHLYIFYVGTKCGQGQSQYDIGYPITLMPQVYSLLSISRVRSGIRKRIAMTSEQFHWEAGGPRTVQ